MMQEYRKRRQNDAGSGADRLIAPEARGSNYPYGSQWPRETTRPG